MKSVNAILNELYLQCKECGISCLAIIGDKNNYDVAYTDNLDALGENLYFAITRDEELFNVVEDTVRIASEVLNFEVKEENNEE
jgi:hypothetical protein